jgi:hypothetical protein
MNDPWVWGLLAVSLGLMLSGLARAGGIYGYPFLAGATFFGFILPQLPALAADPFLPEGAYARAAAFTLLCALACGFGWKAGDRPVAALRGAFDERRLVHAAAAMSLVGAFFFFAFSRLPDEQRLATMATGTPVLYLFFAKLLFFGYVAAVVAFAHRPSLFALAVILFDAAFVIDRLLATGKRGELTEFVLAALLALWFARRIAVPRALALAAVLVASVLMNSVGPYRESVRGAGKVVWDDIARIDVLSNFEDVLRRGGPEMRNAVMRIDFTDRTMALDFGAFHWNVLVFNFVPAQLVGASTKQALIIPEVRPPDYEPAIGSTETGMADAFASFWWLGALKFVLVAYVLARIHRTASDGWVPAQIVYILGITPGMHAITHHTQWVLSSWINMLLLLGPFLLYAAARSRPASSLRLRSIA